MSKASLLELCNDEKMYKVILFPVPDGVSDEGAEMAATYHSFISTVKMQGRSAWENLGKFFTKSLIKRIESSLLELLSVKTLSNIFNGCRDFFSMRPDKFSYQREQRQTCLSYAECSRKSLVCKMYEIVNKQVKILTSQYIGTCKSVYTKGYALN